MSLLWLLRKYADPIAWQNEETSRRTKREVRPKEGDPDLTGILPPPQSPRKKPRFVCRVCGEIGEASDFCATCLAGTMEPFEGREAETADPAEPDAEKLR
jgi:hypothetical protein